MTFLWRSLSSVITAALFATAAQAAVVSYDEFDDGDLETGPIPSQLFFDMAGVHTVSGTISRGDIDNFFFDIGAGLELTAFQIEAVTVPASGVRLAFSNFRLHRRTEANPFAFDPFFFAQLDFLDGDLEIIDPFEGPVGAGGYRLQNGHASTAFSEFPSFGASYTMSFTVEDIAPIPLPASIFPLLAALGGFYALRRRSGQNR